jgi:hypothetical protein
MNRQNDLNQAKVLGVCGFEAHAGNERGGRLALFALRP